MKKTLYYAFLICFLAGCNFSINISSQKNLPPHLVFKKWQQAAVKQDYKQMQKFEDFYFEYVINAFKIYSGKNWSAASPKEKKNFIELYKNSVIKTLKARKNSWADTFLRLNKSYDLKTSHYTVDLVNNSAYLWITYSYPGTERILLVRHKNQWYLVNPFNYHYYLNLIPELIKIKNKS